jgi:hypothetical protein
VVPWRLVPVTINGKKWEVAYDDHRSSQWFTLHIRRQALHKAGYRCRICSTSADAEVYHRSLKRLGLEGELEDVAVMCSVCRASFKGAKIPAFMTDRSQPTLARETVWETMLWLERNSKWSA